MKTIITYLVLTLLLAVPLPAQESSWQDENLRKQIYSHPGFVDRRWHHPFEQEDYQNKEHLFHSNYSSQILAEQNFSDGVETAWVKHYASGLAPSVDVPIDMAVDDSGNVYVTGYHTTGLSGTDYYTVKYNSTGSEVWTAVYNGEGNGDDIAYAIFLDIKGYIYVTGFSVGSGTSNDYATIKYNPHGVQQWVARYNGIGNSSDYATAVAVDVSGNAYVTGASMGVNTDYDITTVKYNPFGVQQWVDSYNGPGNLSDTPDAIGIDKSGNVFVTGESYGINTSHDFITIKYNPAGVMQWALRYDGPAQELDAPAALKIDGSGNIYVTGFSEGVGTGHDYATIKYSTDGVEQWVSRYNRSGSSSDEGIDLAVDRFGDVYVTGQSKGSGSDWDYATVVYNSSGAERWVRRYNGSGNSYDYPSAIDVDDSGNIYVTGESYDPAVGRDFVTVKYNKAGDEQWIVRYNGPGNDSDAAVALCADDSGNVCVTGESDGSGTAEDFTTIKYNTAGIEQWVVRYNGPGNSLDYAAAMTIDGAGNVYVAGKSYIANSNDDFTTVKYTADGTEQWAKRRKGILNGKDYATAICADNEGKVYVTGISEGVSTGSDYLTIKYNAVGSEEWARYYNGPDNLDDEAVAIGIDGFGNVYVTGTSQYTKAGLDVVTIRYSSTGSEQWVARYSSSSNATDIVNAMAVDRLGNVYIAGVTGNPSDYLTIKYNIFGTERWVCTYDGPAHANDGAAAIGFDRSGNVYVTGSSIGSNMSYDYTTIKYNSTGTEQWVGRFDGSGNMWDKASALAVDDSGNVYITGSSGKNIGQDGDYLTFKYNTNGKLRWGRRFTGVADSYDEATAIAVDSWGNVYVTGWSYKGYLWVDYMTIKYNASGVLGWAARYPGIGNSYDMAQAIAVDETGNVYVAGSSESSVGSVFTTIKYRQTPTSVFDHEIPYPDHFWLADNYPNPFNLSTIIEFTLPKSAFVTIKVYNLLGEEIATLVAEQRAAGIYKFNWDARVLASGVYLYRLEAGGFVQTKKLILMR